MINLWECRRFRFLQGFFDRQRFLSTFPFVSCYRGTSELSLAANYLGEGVLYTSFCVGKTMVAKLQGRAVGLFFYDAWTWTSCTRACIGFPRYSETAHGYTSPSHRYRHLEKITLQTKMFFSLGPNDDCLRHADLGRRVRGKGGGGEGLPQDGLSI